MKDIFSRRNFLAAGLALPASALASSSGLALLEEKPTKNLPASGGQLQYRTLGKTGLKLTTMGFGCMLTSDPSVVEKAADLGVNYFDTARGYQGGNNERMVGGALKSRRKSLIISSKSPATTKKEALDNLNTSLKELGTDYLDIWFLHGKSKGSDITEEWLEAQRLAKKEGKIRFSGLSTHGGHAEIIPAVIEHKADIDVLLTSYNFTMDPSMEALVESADKAGLGVVAMKVMAGGFRKAKAGEKLYDTLKREGAMLAALKWVLKNPHVHTTIPSITDMDQLDEDIRAMSMPYSKSDEKTLTAQLEYIRPLYCRMCGECTGACPKGLPVADVLRYLTYAEGYGQFRLGREHFMELPTELRQVRCDRCPACTVECPQGINVGERLSRAQEVFTC
jgi:predicted aldo/keto reductase-like oxidoreductase